MLIQPTVRLQPFGRAVSIFLFGTPENWRFTEPTAKQNILEFAADHGAQTLYAPDCTTFNARVLPADAMPRSRAESLSSGRHIAVSSGIQVDENEIRPREALFIATADCPTVCIYDPRTGKLVAAHAGRASLIDEKALDGGDEREPRSVIDAALALFEARSRLQVFVTCGIRSTNFYHPTDDAKYGDKNRRLLEHIRSSWGLECTPSALQVGRISLQLIIRAQCIKNGVSPDNIAWDFIDTFDDRDEWHAYRWWSHRRDGAAGLTRPNGGLLVP